MECNDFTVEPRYNEPLYSVVLGITNENFCPSNRKIYRKEPLYNYNAMTKQIMMYGSSVWVSTSVDNLNKVFRLQKRTARVILNADTRANSVDLFRELNWLSFS